MKFQLKFLTYKLKTSIQFRDSCIFKFLGHGAENDSWEPESNLDCKEKIQKFMDHHERVIMASEKQLRVAPKKVERLAFNYSARNGKMGRSKNGLRKTYEDMDDSDNE